MACSEFPETTLVLIGHGSVHSADSAAPIYQHADAIRLRGLFDQVVVGFWKQEPALAAVLRGVFASRVVIVPMMISAGYFTEQVYPRELGFERNERNLFTRVRHVGKQTLHYADPVGTHDRMGEVLLARAREVVLRHPFPRPPLAEECSLIIAGHGTSRNENSRVAIDRQVDLLRARKLYAQVEAVFLEEQPRIEESYAICQTLNMVVIPFFMSDGPHSRQDIPIRLGIPSSKVHERLRRNLPVWRNPTEKHGKRLWYGAGVGNAECLRDVILDRVRECISG